MTTDDDPSKPYRPRHGGRGGYDPDQPKKGFSPAAVTNRLLAADHYVEDPAGQVFRYNRRFWEPITDPSLRSRIFDESEPGRTTAHQRNETMAYLRAACHREGLEWGRVGDWEVACETGVIDLLGKRDRVTVRPHRPGDYLDSIIPWGYDPEAQCPVWERCLREWFDEDDTKLDALQEFLGYVTLSHAKLKRALFLYGKGDTGKSVPAKVAKRLAGDRFTCTLPVEHMDNPVRCAVLVGKRLNLLTELPAEAMIADGGFKTLVSTEEPILIDPKHKPPFMYTPTAKHLFASNNLPKVNDKTEATFNRLLVIPFTNAPIPLDKQDRRLDDKLAAEMPGIFRWALDGAIRLARRGGQWSEVKGSAEIVQKLREQSNPAERFINEEMVADPEARTPMSIIAQRFNDWYGGNKRWGVPYVGRRLSEAGRETRRVVDAGGHKISHLFGWRFPEDPPPGPPPAWSDDDGGPIR